MAFDGIGVYQHLFDPQIAEGRLINIALFVEIDAHLIDHLVPPTLTDHGTHQARLVPMHIVARQNPLTVSMPDWMLSSSAVAQH
jgi:hypothetical protein